MFNLLDFAPVDSGYSRPSCPLARAGWLFHLALGTPSKRESDLSLTMTSNGLTKRAGRNEARLQPLFSGQVYGEGIHG
jgi:hypothetical protein